MSTHIHPLQHIPGQDNDRRLTRSEDTVSLGCRLITNLRFADEFDGLAGEVDEVAILKLVERCDKASTAYSMEISAEKTELMTNNASGINTEIKVNGQMLETVNMTKLH